MSDIKEPLKLPTDEEEASFFTTDTSRNEELNSFISDMKRPKEEIPTYGQTNTETEDPGGEPEAAIFDPFEMTEEEEEKVANWLNYDEGHFITAEFMLNQIDKVISFTGMLVTGEDMDKYRIRLKESADRKRETELAAALIKKYNMSLSLEFMFITAILMAYAPVAKTVWTDAKAKSQNKPSNKK